MGALAEIMTRSLIVFVCAGVAGCAGVTDVVATGQDTYLVTSHGPMGLSSGPEQKAKALQRAADYCAALGRQMQTISSADTGAGGFGDTPSAQLQFRCVNPAAPAR